ncbi:Uncharacterised protein [uncultured archaeon]|nr:Uncharacterised protein [uncultured archaeon]
METETITFPCGKFELEKYLRNFEKAHFSLLEVKADEIMQNVRNIMEPYFSIDGSDPLHGYYRSAISGMESAYASRDFQKSFPEAIRYMAETIEWE